MTHVVVRRYIIPNLSDVGDNEKAVLSAAVFVGMLVGGVVCGVLGDKIGRKPCLLYSLALNAVFGFASAFAPHWWWLVVFRVMAGIGVGGSVPSVFTLFAEYLPVHKRGSMLTAVAWFWMVGSIFAAGLAWIVLGWLQHSWRLYAMFAAIPSTSACLLTLVVLPESPRFCANKVRGYAGWVWNHVDLGRVRVHVGWCYTQGDLRKATRLLAGIAARCGVSPMQNRLVLSASNKAKPEPFMKLFHPSIRKDTILLCVIWFTLSFGWYGLILWIPSLFQQVSTLVARTSGCRHAHAAGGGGVPAGALSLESVSRLVHGSCRQPAGQHSVHPSHGHPWPQAGSRLQHGHLCGLCCLVRVLNDGVDDGGHRMPSQCLLHRRLELRTCRCALVPCVPRLLNAVPALHGYQLDCLSTESFPTSLRASAMGLLAAWGRLGSIAGQFVFGALISISVHLLLGVAATMLVIGSCGCASLANLVLAPALTAWCGRVVLARVQAPCQR